MSDIELRLECLKLALQHPDSECPVQRAREFANFVENTQDDDVYRALRVLTEAANA